MWKIWTFTILALILLEVSSSSQQPRKVENLPGLSKMPKFQMFTGYINASSDHQFFYWLNECKRNTSNKLVVWFNGGPGCSSLYGLFEENGPFTVDGETLELHRNPYSWNKLAHILYIESPIGVGFSADRSNLSSHLNDGQVEEWNANALESFLLLHPKYKDAEIYLAGQSYAGVYIAQLASHLVMSNHPNAKNLRGVMISNGLLHKKINLNTQVDYAYYHALIDKKLWKYLKYWTCENSLENCQTRRCKRKVKQFQRTFDNGLNPYNILEPCAMPQMLFNFSDFTDEGLFSNMTWGGIPCVDTTAVERYLNQIDVQNAIGARENDWQSCSGEVRNTYDMNGPDVTQEIKNIIHQKLKIMLVYGDLDLVCNFLGGEAFVDQLGFNVTQRRKQWPVREGDNQGDIGGYYKKMGNLSFYIVKGAGHMVPKDKPAEAFQLLRALLYH